MAGKPGKSSDILEAVALLVVDVQPTFFGVIEGAPAMIERCGFAIEAARTFGLRVIFTEQVPAKLGHTDPRLLGLVRDPHVFAKNTFSALQAEGLQEYLRRVGIYHLLIAGIETPVCVYQTALHAHDCDFDVTVLSDCVTGRRAEDSIVTLDALARSNCHVLPAETVFYSMLGSSANPLFSAFNALVKRYSQPGGLAATPPLEERRTEERFERRRHREPQEHQPAPMAEGDQPDDEDTVETPTREADYENEHDDQPSTEHEEMADVGHGDENLGQADTVQAEENDEPEFAEGTRPKRRGRRRRGGARRRRSRERAAAATNGQADAESSAAPDDRTSAPEPAGPETHETRGDSPA